MLAPTWQADPSVVRRAADLIAELIGQPNAGVSKKMLRWQAGGVTVNISRDGRQNVTVYVAAPCVRESRIIVLDGTGRFRPSSPPKNSNCSREVKDGPTLTFHAGTDREFTLLRSSVERLFKGETMIENDTPVEQFEGGDNEAETLELGEGERRLATQPLDLTIETLSACIGRGQIVLQAEFQREYVWGSGKAGLLIESLLMGIPLHIVYLSETLDGDWEVVDGQQRLTSIHSFVTGRFPDGSPFKLLRLTVRDDLNGRTFAELPRAD